MRRHCLVFLVLLAACGGQSPTAVKPPIGDPWWGGLVDARTLTRYPDSALLVVRNIYLRSSDSSQLYTDSTTIRNGMGAFFLNEWHGKCDMGLGQGSGDLNQYLHRADIYIIVGPHSSLAATLAGPDTLAHYVVGIFNPTISPLPGWGDDNNHPVIWRLTLTNTTTLAPMPLLPVPEPANPVGDINWGIHCNGG